MTAILGYASVVNAGHVLFKTSAKCRVGHDHVYDIQGIFFLLRQTSGFPSFTCEV